MEIRSLYVLFLYPVHPVGYINDVTVKDKDENKLAYNYICK